MCFCMNNIQKQPPIGVFTKRWSENIQQIYRRTPMPKCDFNKVAKRLYWNRTSAWVFSCKFAYIFRTPFPRSTYGWLLLNMYYRYLLFALKCACSYLHICTYSFGSYRGLIAFWHFVFWSPLTLHCNIY